MTSTLSVQGSVEAERRMVGLEALIGDDRAYAQRMGFGQKSGCAGRAAVSGAPGDRCRQAEQAEAAW